MTERRGMIAAAILTLLLCGLCVFLTVRTADAAQLVVQGRASWYGGPCDGYDNNLTATGIPNTVPGIALYRRDTFGDYFLLTRLATLRRVVVRHVDLGPAPWTSMSIDVDPPATVGLGFRAPGGCVQAWPTGEVMRATRLTRRQASRWAKRTRTTVDDRWIWRAPRR